MTDDWIEQPLQLPEQATSACSQFLCEHAGYHMLVQEVFGIADYADNAAKTINSLSQALGVEKKKVIKKDDASGPFTSVAKLFTPILAEMIWCRGVDNFLTYVSQLLGLIFRSRPEMLRSSKMITLDTVLEFDSMDDLIDHLAEKRVHDLAYAGLASLQETLEREIGFSLFPKVDRMKRAVLIVEDRNLITHNRSVVNDVYIKRTGADWVKPGDKQQVGLICAIRCLRFLAAAVVDIDTRAQGKFSLESDLLSEKCCNCVSGVDGKGSPDACHLQ